MADQMPYTIAIVRATDLARDSREVIMHYAFATTDHEDAARQAFRYCGDGSGLKVREITTFDGLPSRRWWPKFDVADVLETTP